MQKYLIQVIILATGLEIVAEVAFEGDQVSDIRNPYVILQNPQNPKQVMLMDLLKYGDDDSKVRENNISTQALLYYDPGKEFTNSYKENLQAAAAEKAGIILNPK